MQASVTLLTVFDVDLLDLSKIEAGRLELTEEVVDLERLIAETCRLVRDWARSNGIALDTGVASDVPPLLADRRATQQMLINLLSNAIKFTAPGGNVTVRAERRADTIVVAVADTGSGFEPGDMETVLAPFGRVDQPMLRGPEGTGLGLSIVRALIALHGGELELVSAVGEGTTATLVFPASRAVDAAERRREA